MTTTYRLRRDDIACSDLGTEIVILDLRSSRYFSASDTGALIVSALADGASLDALVARLVASYDVAASEAAADAEVFLAELRSRDLLEEVAA